MTGRTTNRKMFHVKRGGKSLKLGALSRHLQNWGALEGAARPSRGAGRRRGGRERRRLRARSVAGSARPVARPVEGLRDRWPDRWRACATGGGGRHDRRHRRSPTPQSVAPLSRDCRVCRYRYCAGAWTTNVFSIACGHVSRETCSGSIGGLMRTGGRTLEESSRQTPPCRSAPPARGLWPHSPQRRRRGSTPTMPQG